MINWPQLGKNSALLLLSFPCILTEFLRYETRFMLASSILQVLVCKIANVQWRHTIGDSGQKHPFYFDGELVADIDSCCKYRQ